MTNLTKTLRFALFGLLALVSLCLVAKPAHAEFGIEGGYKYLRFNKTKTDFHVGQINFLWSKGGGYYTGTHRSQHAFGFGLAIGGNKTKSKLGTITTSEYVCDAFSFGGFFSETCNTIPIEMDAILPAQTNVYFGIPLLYEYVFPFGLGISGGLTIPITYSKTGKLFDSDLQDINRISRTIGAGIGVNDLGLSYHFKNGLTLYTRADLIYLSTFSIGVENGFGGEGGLLWGVGGGVGYWF